jgi:hypothetical protein
MDHDGPTKTMTAPDIKRDSQISIRPTANPNMTAQIDTSVGADPHSVVPDRRMAAASEAHRSMLGALWLPHGRFYLGGHGRSRSVMPGCLHSWLMRADSSFPRRKAEI